MKIKLLGDVECPTSAEMFAWCKARGWLLPGATSGLYARVDVPEDVLGVPVSLWLPIGDSVRDFPRRMAEAMQECALCAGMTPAQVACEMTAGRGGAA